MSLFDTPAQVLEEYHRDKIGLRSCRNCRRTGYSYSILSFDNDRIQFRGGDGVVDLTLQEAQARMTPT